MGIIRRLISAISGRTDDDDVSVSLSSQIKGLQRGDFCKVISTIRGLSRGTEVMVSGIYRSNRRYVDVVDYRRNYYKIHEIHLLKI